MIYKVYRLTNAQATNYERHGILPNTDHCKTVSVDRAHELVTEHEGSGVARWVGGNYRFIVDLPHKSWCKKISGGTAVMQMVRGGRSPINRRRLETMRNET